MEIYRFSSLEAAQAVAIEALARLLKRYSDKPILFLAAGGSSLGLLSRVDEALLGSHVTFALSDDRYSRDPKVNSWSGISNTEWLRVWRSRGVNTIESLVHEGESLEQFAGRIESRLKEWRARHPEGAVLMTQGVGPDGHTQGIMPFPENPSRFSELFENPDRWYVGYDATGKNPHPLRGTITNTFLLTQVTASVVYMAGEAKRDAFERMVAEEGSLAETPARIVREMKNAMLFTDIHFGNG